jgi:N-acetylglucosamine kinase-like BadF-type ATPase
MSELILGIDGGGTKTHAIVVDLSGNILAAAAHSGANWERTGITATEIILQEITHRVLDLTGATGPDIVAATFALAGIDWDSDLDMFKPISKLLSLGQRAVFVNDSIAALFAGIPNGIGCVSIAGTGGKTTGRNQTQTLQTMGMDLGEGGGAGQLVSLALDYIARIYHGIEKPSELTQLILKESGFKDESALFKAVARYEYRLNEELAPKIFALATAGDFGAITITNLVATQHASDVVAMINRLGLANTAVPVIRAGGLHTAGCAPFDLTFEKVLKSSQPGSSSKVLSIAPVYGAVVHAAHAHFGEIPTTFLNNLFDQARKKGDL